MTSKTRLRVASHLPSVLTGLALAACSTSSTIEDEPTGTSTGTTATVGTSATAGTTAGTTSPGTTAAVGTTTGIPTTGSTTTGTSTLGGTTTGTSAGPTTGTSTVGAGGGTTDAGPVTTGAGGTGVVAGGYPENTGAECDVSAGAMANNPLLPDPFAMNDGTRISTMAEWACRRNEIKKDIEQFEIGPKPEPPMVEASMMGNTLNVVVTTSAGSITLTSNVSGSGSSDCVGIGMNGNAGLISGCVQVPFMHDQVVTYGQNSNKNQNDPFYKVYPDLWNKIGNYTAWSWGISRIIDGLDQVKDELGIDMSKIGVHGCSYAGKMALFGGAFDERVALTIAQESGGGGINAWRTSQEFTDRTGTDIEKIDNTNYSWFMQSMQMLNPASLPHDHHELIAMIAPRAVIALGNRDYEWLGDESGYKSVMAAKEVWKAMGLADRMGFDFTTGHAHCQAAQSQQTSAAAFVNKFLKGQEVDTNIEIAPPANGFDLEWSAEIDWETPPLN